MVIACVSIGTVSKEPDWTIQIPGREGLRLTDHQRALLQKIEDELLAFGRAAQDVSALQAKVAPVVLALLDSGLAVAEIADNSRLRPQFVEMIVHRGDHLP